MAIQAAGDLRGLLDDELVTKLREAKEELFNLRFQQATGQLENHGRMKAVKAGRVMFELSGVPEPIAREAMRRAIHKLPMKCRFVKREVGDV